MTDPVTSESAREGENTVPSAVPGISPETRRANRRLTWQLSFFALGFLGFGFALVPLYDVLCEVTGYGNRQNLTEASEIEAPGPGVQREITVEFVSTNPTVGEWEFRAVEHSARVKTGQLYAAKFVAKNLLAKAATGQAVPDIAPRNVEKYFRKTECFCFTPQHFDALQERELEVRFVVDSQLPENVDRITLAYSLYGVAQQVASR
jgi:cytochrome c oxidase assembly protein subunit 11